MVDHIRALLLNSGSVAGCRHVDDGPADAVMARFGVTGSAVSDAVAVDRLLPLAMAPDLSVFRRFFDRRTTPRPPMSPYSQTDDTLSPSGLYASVLTGDGWWDTTGLFMSDDPVEADVLTEMRKAASSRDVPYALGAVLIACAYRRLVRQEVA